MNLFEFLTNMYTAAAHNFVNFAVITFFTLLNGILLVAMLNAISNIRLFGGKESKKEDSLKNNPVQENDSKSMTVYDMLIKAYEEHKNKGGNKSDS
jgi:hypothetical protein